ncbi:ABC transporter permease [Celeribacter halophilus]|uniref:ABC transporter permease n=1 Tax=Celeribacter halophilus TaxID=576117 RepID=UPI0026E128A7|nr:ABC transporter permease [Celeribacter halophilus]MDO6721646.1 ABC transporter permease [Celeribacter halophilus]
MTHRQPTVNPIPHWSERHGWRSLGAFTGVLALSFIFAPILWLVVMSFSEDPLSGFPGPFTITYYRELLDQTGWVAPLLKSLGIAAAVSVVSMVASTLIGRAIPRIRRGKVALTGIVLLPMMIPGVVIGTALFLYFRVGLDVKLGLWSLFLGHLIWALPFSFLSVLIVALRFDVRLLDAASDLGSGPFERFWRVELPLLKDGIISGGLFAFLLSFNEIARSIYLKGKTETLPIYLWQQAASHSSHVPLIYPLNVLILIASSAIVALAFWVLFGRNKQ